MNGLIKYSYLGFVDPFGGGVGPYWKNCILGPQTVVKRNGRCLSHGIRIRKNKSPTIYKQKKHRKGPSMEWVPSHTPPFWIKGRSKLPTITMLMIHHYLKKHKPNRLSPSQQKVLHGTTAPQLRWDFPPCALQSLAMPQHAAVLGLERQPPDHSVSWGENATPSDPWGVRYNSYELRAFWGDSLRIYLQMNIF